MKADTVLVWLRRAAAHALSIEQVLLEDYHLSACQIDALWTYSGSKEKKPGDESGSYWVGTLLESETRLRVGRGVSVSEGDAAQRLWRRWRWRLASKPPPPLVSDGWGGHQEALLNVFGSPVAIMTVAGQAKIGSMCR